MLFTAVLHCPSCVAGLQFGQSPACPLAFLLPRMRQGCTAIIQRRSDSFAELMRCERCSLAGGQHMFVAAFARLYPTGIAYASLAMYPACCVAKPWHRDTAIACGLVRPGRDKLHGNANGFGSLSVPVLFSMCSHALRASCTHSREQSRYWTTHLRPTPQPAVLELLPPHACLATRSLNPSWAPRTWRAAGGATRPRAAARTAGPARTRGINRRA